MLARASGVHLALAFLDHGVRGDDDDRVRGAQPALEVSPRDVGGGRAPAGVRGAVGELRRNSQCDGSAEASSLPVDVDQGLLAAPAAAFSTGAGLSAPCSSILFSTTRAARRPVSAPPFM
jgi:hypothetical protein